MKERKKERKKKKISLYSPSLLFPSFSFPSWLPVACPYSPARRVASRPGRKPSVHTLARPPARRVPLPRRQLRYRGQTMCVEPLPTSSRWPNLDICVSRLPNLASQVGQLSLRAAVAAAAAAARHGRAERPWVAAGVAWAVQHALPCP